MDDEIFERECLKTSYELKRKLTGNQKNLSIIYQSLRDAVDLRKALII